MGCAHLAERLRQPTLQSASWRRRYRILSAIAAFTISIPDRSRWWVLIPVPTLVLWISTACYDASPTGSALGRMVYAWARRWVVSPASADECSPRERTDHNAAMPRWCVQQLSPCWAVLPLLRHFDGVRDLHHLHATVMILVWNLGTAALITAIGCLFGPQMLGSAATRFA